MLELETVTQNKGGQEDNPPKLSESLFVKKVLNSQLHCLFEVVFHKQALFGIPKGELLSKIPTALLDPLAFASPLPLNYYHPGSVTGCMTQKS